ncbi:MAG: prepilin-type N-terminal cleavage/methylation domain-containing protein [Candidatus Omnitrophota bacterium]
MNKKGLTLVEAVVAIIIFSLVNFSILATFVMLKASNVNMRHYLQAMHRISSKLEGLKAQNYSSVVAIPSAPVVIDNNGTPLDASDDTTGTYSQAVNEVQDAGHLNSYKIVSANIVWQEKSYAGTRNISASLVTIITE